MNPFTDVRGSFKASPPEVSIVVCGHTHMQFDRTIAPAPGYISGGDSGRMRIVNAGSVGMPFGDPGADWLLLGPEVQLRHTPYDLEKAAERIRDTSYTEAEEFAAKNVLEPPSEEEMLDLFKRAELK